MTKRILYFNSWSTAHGGSSTSLIDIVSRLDKSKFDPLVVCPEEGELPERLRTLGVPVLIERLSRCNRDEFWRFLAEVPRYVTLLRRHQVALVHGNTSASRRSLLQAVQLTRLPYIQHVRNIVKQPREQVGFRLARRIIANSNSAAAVLRSDALFAEKTITIYNAVDLSRYESRADKRNLLSEADRPVIGFVGQIVPRKGITTLIRAMPDVLEAFPTALALIVGCAPPDESEYEVECRGVARTLGIEDHVRFVGYHRDVPAWMRTFDVFALPTKAEPFGKVVIEAMAAERPVVASNVGGIPEILSDARLGTLIPPDDPTALAAGILRYLRNPIEARRVGEDAAQHVRRTFGLDRMIARLEAVYHDLLRAADYSCTAEEHAGIVAGG